MKLNLETKTKEQEHIKTYLEENASDVLADKINNGVQIEKDDKQLINKKDLESFMKYACEEAKKQAEKGAHSACIEDTTVFGWAIHYFEENEIIGTLYNLDGTKYEAPKPKVEPPTVKPVIKEEPKNVQMSMFDLMAQEEPTEEADDEQVEEEPVIPEQINTLIDLETGEITPPPQHNDETQTLLETLFGGNI